MSSSALTRRLVLLVNRTLQWSSAVIVMGLTAYLISKRRHTNIGEHMTFIIVISCLSVLIFLPAFFSPFMPHALSKMVMTIDIVFSYLWLTGFIFAAQDYNWHHQCRENFPRGVSCSKKYADEAFIFLAFFFTFVGIFLEFWSLWACRNETSTTHPPKGDRAQSSDTGHQDGPTESRENSYA